jgi:hypothetical protein
MSTFLVQSDPHPIPTTTWEGLSALPSLETFASSQRYPNPSGELAPFLISVYGSLRVRNCKHERPRIAHIIQVQVLHLLVSQYLVFW